MDDTRELKLERRDESLARISGEDARREVLEGIARAMHRAGREPRAVAAAAIDAVLDVLDFERGFVLLAAPNADPLDESLERGRLRPLAARLRRGGAAELVQVRNPEFAVNHSVIKRALAGRKPLAVPDCLLQPAPGTEEQHRAVLCQPLDLAPRLKGVLYLDRGLGGGEIEDACTSFLEDFADRLSPILAVACLAADLDRLRDRLGAVAEESGIEEERRSAAGEEEAAPPDEIPSFHGMIGRDEKLQKIIRVVEKVKDSDLNVCIFGESGTGKELLARAIHDSSLRGGKLFVAENCGAIAENLLESELFGHVKGAFTGADEDRKGLFELADGGTLFLDEIGDMSEGMQRKLLRVLQEGLIRPIGGKQASKVNVRVICASNRDLKHLVQKGAFRADLYYRLNVITIELPPLRDRPDDIPFLVHHFAAALAEEEGVRKRFSESAMKAICQYPWPGNIRELRNVIRRVAITCPHRVIARKDVIGLLNVSGSSPRSGLNMERDDKDLILRVPARESFHEIIEECERVVILNALNQFAWNKSKVTKALRIPRQSLYNKIAKFQLERTWGTTPEAGSPEDPRER
jgi:transcriptional regulator with GAF, ATPase, and Fis domain